MHATLPLLNALGFLAIRRGRLEALQVNLTYRCNQHCLHCHVNAGPTRSEAMTDESLALLHQVIDAHPVQTLDLTGGAPEMHTRFREIVTHARREGLRVIDRCNLTILGEPGYADLTAFLAEQGVEVTASLPCPATRARMSTGKVRAVAAHWTTTEEQFAMDKRKSALLAIILLLVAGFFLINLAMGLTKLPARTFWWVSQLGMQSFIKACT